MVSNSEQKVEKMQPELALHLQGITKTFGDFTALREVSLEVEAGATICIIGPSGSGKSTLLRCCNLLEVPNAGSIHVYGDQYFPLSGKQAKLTRRELRTRTAMVFQSFELFPHLTAVDNVAIGPVRVKKVDREQARARGLELLDSVGLKTFAERKPRTLSGGQQQRVSIARALAMDPEVLLFDEPTSALDPEMVGEVLAIMRDLAHTGISMIVVTHEIRFALDAASKVVVMDHGEVVEVGPPSRLFESPEHARTKAFLEAIRAE